MNCETIRKELQKSNEITEEIEQHISNCKDCENWLKEEVKKAPEGLTSQQWNKVISNINLNEVKDEKLEGSKIVDNNDKLNNSENNKTFSDYYFSGLKYGIVFGLAVVFGFSILQNLKDNNQIINEENNKEVKTSVIASDSATIGTSSIDLNR